MILTDWAVSSIDHLPLADALIVPEPKATIALFQTAGSE
jgi:hypothetical protein